MSSRNYQNFALVIPLLYTPYWLLHVSGSFLDPSELLEIQIEWVVYHIVCGCVACVPECRGSICAYALSLEAQQTDPR
jgi:hypothetical protein